MMRKAYIWMTVGGLLFAATACGDDDEGSEDSAPTAEASEPAASDAPDASDTTVSESAVADLGDQLTVVSWGGVADEASQFFAGPFAEANSINVEFLPQPGEQVAGLQAQAEAGSIQWDVMDAVGLDQTAALSTAGLLATLPDDLKARLEELMPGAVTDYGIKYGTLSNIIACNAAAVEKCPTTPAEFFDLENFPGRRIMNGVEPLVAMAFALAADGVPYDEIFPMDIERAFAKLETIKPELVTLYSSGDEFAQLFQSGETDMGIAWNGRAYTLMQEAGPDLDLQVSWDGAVYAPTELAVVKDAPHMDAALAYVEWVASHPDAMAEYSTLTTYGFPNPTMFDTLDPELAKWLPEHPDHFDMRIDQDFVWYAENKTAVDDAWKEFTTG
jgi:spermidine/putrescine-binding protein